MTLRNIFIIGQVHRQYNKKSINNIKPAGVHAHGAGEGEGADFVRGKFDDSFACFRQKFLDVEGGYAKSAGARLDVVRNQSDNGGDAFFECNVGRAIAGVGNVDGNG
ncbi:MAG: hypothetical protein UV68_C0052G0009, partial [Candidatus Collierbacteria bacterium GW2011_GWC2_43_12]